MYKFIFVCYENGAGGENLCRRISDLPGCHTLKYHKERKRTQVDDVFAKALISRATDQYARENLGKEIHIPKIINDSDLCHVVPSHISPDVLKKFYPNDLYVVINSPTDQYWLRKLNLRKYRYYFLSRPPSFRARVGEYEQYSPLKNTDHIKQLLSSSMTILQIRCLSKNLPLTKQNYKKYFKNLLLDSHEYRLYYTDDVNTVTIEFKDIYKNNLQPLFNKIHKKLEANR